MGVKEYLSAKTWITGITPCSTRPSQFKCNGMNLLWLKQNLEANKTRLQRLDSTLGLGSIETLNPQHAIKNTNGGAPRFDPWNLNPRQQHQELATVDCHPGPMVPNYSDRVIDTHHWKYLTSLFFDVRFLALVHMHRKSKLWVLIIANESNWEVRFSM